MFRQAAPRGAARVVASMRSRAAHVRCSSATRRPNSTPSWALGVLTGGAVAGGCCYSYYHYCSGRGAAADRLGVGPDVPAIPGVGPDVPAIPSAASEAEIPVESPVAVLGLGAANARLREHAQSFVFRGRDGGRGRVDVVRVASNSPVEDEWALGFGRGLGGGDALYAGVYDGHAGWATSAVLKTALIGYVANALAPLPPASDDTAVATAMQDAFSRLDARIMDGARRQVEAGLEPGAAAAVAALAPAVAGSCALLAVYEPASATLRTAVTGDSRAVLGRWSGATGGFSAEALSRDQTGFNEDEVRRLDAEHPGELGAMVDRQTGRLLGMAVTRAFGDHRWKWADGLVRTVQAGWFGLGPRPGCKTPPYMTARPEVTTRRVATADFAILASDGLWDVMSSEHAVACVERWLAARRAGVPEPVADAPPAAAAAAAAADDDDDEAPWQATPESFAIEDLDSAAVCLVKNALGGRRRAMFCGALTACAPLSRYVRDDMTVQVVFFSDPYVGGNGGKE